MSRLAPGSDTHRGHGPLKLGTCHKKGWQDQPGFPCYRWFYFERHSLLPKISCKCGGSYPRPPPDASDLQPRLLDTILTGENQFNQTVAPAVIDDRDLPHSKLGAGSVADDTISNILEPSITTTKSPTMETQNPTTYASALLPSPRWHVQTIARRDGSDSDDTSNKVENVVIGIFFAIVVGVASILLLSLLVMYIGHAIQQRRASARSEIV